MMSAIPLYLALATGQTTKRADVRLVDLTPVSQVAKASVFKMTKEFSIGGVVLREGVQLLPQGTMSPDRGGRLVYSVPRNSQVFRGQFGIPDSDSDSVGDATMTVSIDGGAPQEFHATSGQKPTPIEISIRGARSIMFQFNGVSALGNALFSMSSAGSQRTPTKPPAQVETPPKTTPTDMGRANLTEPENGTSAKDSITFRWDAIAGAISYGVEIVMISNANPNKIPTRFLRSYAAKSSAFEWNFSDDVLSGEYQVSVIAFGKDGVLTKFSNSRRFKVDRK